MKGIIFNEFLEMVEEKFGYNLVDEILMQSPLPSDGIYTSVGSYENSEIHILFSKLSEKTQIPIEKIEYSFGLHLFKVFSKIYSYFFIEPISALDFLYLNEQQINTEIKKLLEDTEFPLLKVNQRNNSHILTISSSKPIMVSLIHGLLHACLTFYGEKPELRKHVLKKDRTEVQFDFIYAHTFEEVLIA